MHRTQAAAFAVAWPHVSVAAVAGEVSRWAAGQEVSMRRQAHKTILLHYAIFLLLASASTGYAATSGSERWLWRQAKKAHSIEIAPLQGGSPDAHNYTNMAIQMTGVPTGRWARTSNPTVMRRLLKTIHYSGSLSNGKHWNTFFYYEHLEDCPKIDLTLFQTGNQTTRLRLFLWVYRKHYWLEQRARIDNNYPRRGGGMIAVEPASFRRFLHLFRTLVAQAKHGGSGLETFIPPGDGD